MRARSHTSAEPKVRRWFLASCFLYLLVFLLWFSRWQHAPQSHSAHLLGGLFLTMTLLWAIPMLLGVLWYGDWFHLGLRDVVRLAREIYEIFLKKDTGNTTAPAANPVIISASERPSLIVTKWLKNGTPVRGTCPICEVEFSTEAFDKDKAYPHESKLEQWYGEHFQYHLCDLQE